MIKFFILATWLVMFIPQVADAVKDKPFSQIIPMRVLCTEGGAEYLILELMQVFQ